MIVGVGGGRGVMIAAGVTVDVGAVNTMACSSVGSTWVHVDTVHIDVGCLDVCAASRGTASIGVGGVVGWPSSFIGLLLGLLLVFLLLPVDDIGDKLEQAAHDVL